MPTHDRVPTPTPSIELITEATKLWSRRRTDPHYAAFDFDADLFALERRYGLDVTPCEDCGRRHGTLRRGYDVRLCRWCLGDRADRGWDAYRDAEEWSEHSRGGGHDWRSYGGDRGVIEPESY